MRLCAPASNPPWLGAGCCAGSSSAVLERQPAWFSLLAAEAGERWDGGETGQAQHRRGGAAVLTPLAARPPSYAPPCLPCSYSGVQYDQAAVRIQLGGMLLMDKGQPLEFDAKVRCTGAATVTSAAGFGGGGGSSNDGCAN